MSGEVQNPFPPGVSEKDFQAALVDYARLRGWMVYHTYDSRRSVPGFPDLVLVHPVRGVMFRELKTDKGRVSKAQRDWLAAINKAGGDAGLWRPRDWPDIERDITGQTSIEHYLTGGETSG